MSVSAQAKRVETQLTGQPGEQHVWAGLNDQKRPNVQVNYYQRRDVTVHAHNRHS